MSQTQDVCFTRLKVKKKSVDTNTDLEATTYEEKNYQLFFYSCDRRLSNCSQDNIHLSSIASQFWDRLLHYEPQM